MTKAVAASRGHEPMNHGCFLSNRRPLHDLCSMAKKGVLESWVMDCRSSSVKVSLKLSRLFFRIFPLLDVADTVTRLSLKVKLDIFDVSEVLRDTN